MGNHFEYLVTLDKQFYDKKNEFSLSATMMRSAVVAFLSLLLAGQSNSKDILCPGKPSSDYCDCGGACPGHPEFCSCEEAQACCEDATPTVLCPGQPSSNYCDCGGDCTEHPEFCSCEEGQSCCEGAGPELAKAES